MREGMGRRGTSSSEEAGGFGIDGAIASLSSLPKSMANRYRMKESGRKGGVELVCLYLNCGVSKFERGG